MRAVPITMAAMATPTPAINSARASGSCRDPEEGDLYAAGVLQHEDDENDEQERGAQTPIQAALTRVRGTAVLGEAGLGGSGGCGWIDRRRRGGASAMQSGHDIPRDGSRCGRHLNAGCRRFRDALLYAHSTE
jgi:hypothetical protein